MKRTSRPIKRRTSRLAANTKAPGRSSRRSTSSKDLKKLIDLAESQGWAVEVTGGGHLRFISPDRRMPMVHTGSTPSDRRSIKNLESQLRKSGLKIERSEKKGSPSKPRKNASNYGSMARLFPPGAVVEFILGDRSAGIPAGTTAVVQAVRGDSIDVAVSESDAHGLVGEHVTIEMVYPTGGSFERVTEEQLLSYLRRVQ